MRITVKTLYVTMFLIVATIINPANLFAQPANNTCSYAQPLTVNTFGNCIFTSGSTLNATQNIPGCVGNADDDVWYSFVATSTSMQVTVESGIGFDAVLQVFSGGCSVLINMGCVDNTANGGVETFSSTNFVVGQTYRARVYHYGIGSGSGNFDICVTEAPSAPINDICGNAIDIPISTTCNYQTFNNNWATESYPGCAGNADDDVWFKFTATNAVHEIKVNPNGSLMDPVVELYSGTCTALNSMVCMDNGWFDDEETINAVGLIPGNTYYFRVYDYYTNWDATFDVCVTGTPTPAPTNDEPCNAISLPTVTSACDYSRFTNVGATQTSTSLAPFPSHTGYDASCETGSATGYTANSGDVWFKVTVPASGTVNIQMEPNLGAGGIVTDGVMALYTGTCGNLTQIAYSNDYSCYPPSVTNPISTLMPFISQSGLTPGSEVYIRFWNWSNSSKGEFGFCVTDAINDDCADALYICDVNGYKGTTGAFYTADRPDNMRGNVEMNNPPTYTYTSGTDQGGIFGHWWDPPSHPYRSPNLDVQIDNNSWIRFTASATTAVLNVDVYDCYREKGIQMQIFSSDGCSNFYPTSEFKEDANQFTLTATNLTVGDDYLLMIDGYAGDVCSYEIRANSGVQFPDIEPINPSFCQGGSVVLTGPAGATSYEWVHSGENTQSVTVNPSTTTTYTLIVEGLCNHKQTLTTQVLVKQPPTITLSTGNVATVCAGESITITASGADSYVWDNGSTSNSITVNPTSQTTYTVTGELDGCTTQETVTVNIVANPNVSLTPSANSICVGNSVSLTASGAVSYAWSHGLGTGSSKTVSPTTNQTYQVTGTDANGCQSIATVPITVNQLPNVVASASSYEICNGASTTLTASGASNYTWNQGLGNGSTKTVSPTSNQTYQVTGTDGNGCQNTSNVSVVVNPLPNVNVVASDQYICDGESLTLTASGSSGLNYSWSHGLGSGTSKSVTPSVNTTYTVTGTDSKGCQNTANASVTVNSLPTVAIGSVVNPANCGENGTITLNFTNVPNGVYTIYYNGGSFTNVTVTNGTATVSAPAGGYSNIRIENQNGCMSAITADAMLNDPNAPVATASSPQSSICEGENIQLIGTGASGATYNWTGPNGYSSTNQSPLITSAGVNNSGTYHFTLTENGCSNSASVTVVVNPIPDVSILVAQTELCEGDDLQLNSNVNGGGSNPTFEWTGPNSYSSSAANPFVSNLTPNMSGTYVLNVEGLGGCPSNTASVDITVTPTPATPTGDDIQEFCDAAFVNDLAVQTGNVSWYNASGDLLSGNEGLIDNEIYYATQTVNGCESETFEVLVAINISPVAGEIVGDADLCEDVISILTASGDAEGIWVSSDTDIVTIDSSGEITAVASGQATITYIVEGEGACQDDQAEFIIDVHANPILALPNSELDVCDGDDVQLFGDLSNEGDISNPTFTWSGPNQFESDEQNPIIPNISTEEEGTYYVSVVSEHGCGLNENGVIEIVVNALPNIDSVFVEYDKICLGTEVNMHVVGADDQYTYVWVFDGEEVAEGSEYHINPTYINNKGVYYIYAQNDAGCEMLVQQIELEIEACEIEIVEAFSPNGDGTNDYFNIENLEAYPNTEVWIYTRWGLQVFHSDDYQNDWDGTSQNNLKIGGEELPEGTYYYVLKLGGEDLPNSGEIYKGFVYLKR